MLLHLHTAGLLETAIAVSCNLVTAIAVTENLEKLEQLSWHKRENLEKKVFGLALDLRRRGRRRGKRREGFKTKRCSSSVPFTHRQIFAFAKPHHSDSFAFATPKVRMYNNIGPQPGVPQPPVSSQPNPFGNAFQVASSGLIRGGLGAYGEKIFGSSSEYVQSNITKYLADPQYYFQVNDQYVKNKLKVVLFPFLHRGHWTRITEPVGGRLSYKPPIYDINAPDLYIPLMAFGTYVVIAGISLGLGGKFSPEALNWLFIKGVLGWFMQVILLKVTLLSLGTGEAPLWDIIAYAGYTFPGICLAVLGRIISSYSYYFLMPWTCLSMGVFLVKTMKRVLFSEVRSYDSSRHHYLLLFIALAQFPLFTWLGNITVNWLI